MHACLHACFNFHTWVSVKHAIAISLAADIENNLAFLLICLVADVSCAFIIIISTNIYDINSF